MPFRTLANLRLLAAALIVMCCYSCNTIQCGSNKGLYLEQFSAFIDDAVEEEMSVIDKRWRIYDDRLEAYMLDCYPLYAEEMSLFDKQEVFTNAMIYYYTRYGSHMVKELQNEENPVSVMIMDEIPTIWEDPSELIREFTGEEWEQLVDEFINDLDKWQRKLRELLNELE